MKKEIQRKESWRTKRLTRAKNTGSAREVLP